MLGSWPVWDDGFFESLDREDGVDGENDGSGIRSEYSSQRLRGNRRSSSRDYGASVNPALVNTAFESLDPHVMVVPEPYRVQDPAIAGPPSAVASSERNLTKRMTLGAVRRWSQKRRKATR